ncbi:MAG TPA: hypothetical protein VI855_06590, partial [Dehalococcoidia bacterium]|nr:hypothetical protein [Dehalococcoidia bacterium]
MLRPVVAGLLLALLAACGGLSTPGADAPPAAPQVPAALLAPRPTYDVSLPFPDLVKPHFYSRSRLAGDLVAAVRPQGMPDLILEREGKVKLRFKVEGRDTYLDPLALESGLLGEHPVHKVYRLQAMGVPVERGLARRLRAEPFPHHLFQTIQFEYLPGKELAGVIAEVFPDGTFLVIPFGPPEEWRADQSAQPDMASPSHFHVNARALSAKDSTLAKAFEAEILALPFDEQRYPAPPLAQKDCQVYQESLGHAEYRQLLAEVGYHFTPAHVLPPEADGPLPLGEALTRMLRREAGTGVE